MNAHNNEPATSIVSVYGDMSFRLYVRKDMLEKHTSNKLKTGQYTTELNTSINILQIILDRLSIWGGADSSTDTQLSWEFRTDIRPAVDAILLKFFNKGEHQC